MSNISSIIKMIDMAATQKNYKEVENLISVLDISDQHGIHSLLKETTIKVITENKDKINIAYSVKEHIIGFHFYKLSWSDDMLDQLIKIYKEERYLALESRVISAIKSDEIIVSQLNKLESIFSSKEFIKQIESWKKRNCLA
ncbi:hypothetical protein SAMN04488542_13842 [Fontibacillus panacisegetis]|uniref:Uncharacterized protein n=1 Tax=Fontibacillus panacisegetis TaxID=670482 RepID=A0A1G7TP63_9BACL|nr:hypothetical protein [Fontibacillus panacisegetis]SDG37116.1 hypothetical protein SAMN04488542_13842 [Fontibacillus panacisegetis]